MLSAVAAGDAAAWSALLERYRPFVLGRLRQARKTRNWFWLTELDDVVQDVLVQFYEAVQQGRFTYRDEHALRGFLVQTTFFVVMKHKDAATGEQALSDLWVGDEADDLERRFALVEFAESAFDPLGRRDCLRELYQAIDRLPEARREVLRLTLLGLHPRDIAPRMKRTANAVSVLKFHALDELRRALEQTDFAANCGEYFTSLGSEP